MVEKPLLIDLSSDGSLTADMGRPISAEELVRLILDPAPWAARLRICGSLPREIDTALDPSVG